MRKFLRIIRMLARFLLVMLWLLAGFGWVWSFWHHDAITLSRIQKLPPTHVNYPPRLLLHQFEIQSGLGGFMLRYHGVCEFVHDSAPTLRHVRLDTVGYPRLDPPPPKGLTPRPVIRTITYMSPLTWELMTRSILALPAPPAVIRPQRFDLRWRNSVGGVLETGDIVRGVVLPYWTVVTALGVLTVIAYLRPLVDRIRERRRRRVGLCKKCGYDLRASSDRCPECGTPIAVAAA